MADDQKQDDIRGRHILVTGGAGYIGTHTVIELVNAGYSVTIVDNLVNSSPEAVTRIKHILGSKAAKVSFHELDCCDAPAFEAVFKAQSKPFDAVIHFAGLKAVGESVSMPVRYYDNNLTSTLVLLKLMEKYKASNLVFSSSATVYGDVKEPPSTGIPETQRPLNATNPYGKTKLIIEDILRDTAVGSPGKWKIAILRYFNPFGAHPSGLIGEDPCGIPNNLTPFILQVAVGLRSHLNVFGGDYSTVDGTGVRDYIHVVDLAHGHLAALEQGIFGGKMTKDCDEFNLGSGTGVSVLQMLAAFAKASGKALAHKIVDRRPGDVAQCVCDPSKANRVFGWKVQKTLEDATVDGWRWQSQNPKGYASTK